MQRDDQYLFDILDAARLATSYVSSKSNQDFLKDIQCQDAVIRRLEIIGEASRRVSEQTRARLRQIPWHALVGMRNLMIHEYDDVDLTIVWNTVNVDLPILIAEIEKILPG